MTVITSAVDMSGVNTGFATIVAEAFGLSPDQIRVVSADTATGPYSGASGGSKVTYTVGEAVLRAAEAAREKLLAAASEELEIAPADLEVVDGVVRAVGAPDRSITVAEISGKALRFGGRYEPIEGHGGSAQTSGAAVGRRPPRPRPRGSRDRRDRAPRPRDRTGRRPSAQPGARRGPDARRHDAGHRLGALRGARARRERPAADGLVHGLRDPGRRARPGHRHAHRGGAGARRPLRRQRGRGGTGDRRRTGDRECRRGATGHADA